MLFIKEIDSIIKDNTAKIQDIKDSIEKETDVELVRVKCIEKVERELLINILEISKEAINLSMKVKIKK